MGDVCGRREVPPLIVTWKSWARVVVAVRCASGSGAVDENGEASGEDG